LDKERFIIMQWNKTNMENGIASWVEDRYESSDWYNLIDFERKVNENNKK